jgi:hypothetical protein
MGLTGNARVTHTVTIRDTFLRSQSGRAYGPDVNMVTVYPQWLPGSSMLTLVTRQQNTYNGYEAAVYLQWLPGSSILTLVTKQQYTYTGYQAAVYLH